MAVVEKPRPTWRPRLWPAQLPSSSDVTAWLVSATVHFAVLVIMASITLLLPIQQRVLLSAFPLPELEEEPLTAQDFHFSVDPHEHVGALGAGELGTARPVAPTEAELSELSLRVGPDDTIGEIEVRDFDRTVLEGPSPARKRDRQGRGQRRHQRRRRRGRPHHARNSAVARRTADAGRVAVRSIGQPQAATRIDRQAVRSRLRGIGNDRGRRQRRRSSSIGEKPLLTAVAQFGTAVELITPKPIDDLTEIKAAVRADQRRPAGNGQRKCVSVGRATSRRSFAIIGSPGRDETS